MMAVVMTMIAMKTIMIMMIAIRDDKHGKDDNDGNADYGDKDDNHDSDKNGNDDNGNG